MDKITVYDANDERIGDTFSRRAKQLVLKNRAVWYDDGNLAIRLIKEEKQMEIYPADNGKIIDLREDAPTADDAENKLLMYLAKRNVRKRRNLIVHILAWIVTAFFVLVVTDGFSHRGGVSTAVGLNFPFEFYLGVYLTWGIIILHKAYVVVQTLLSKRTSNSDAVSNEYSHLKNVSSKNIDDELKRL
ncbi:MAG: hypothetical protein FWE33_06845 [Defluviitaleaceae bacterium]|nr:hypothetical protein [Defluviitaleaceae bacterium]